LIAVSIFVIVSLMATESLNQGRHFWQTTIFKSELQLDGQQAIDYMVTELRNTTRTAGTKPPDINIPAAGTSIKFYLPTDIDGNGLIVDATGNTEWATGGPIQYQYVPGQNQLRRLEGGNQRILANNVSSVTFDDQSTDGSLNRDEIKISLTLQKTTTQEGPISVFLVSIIKLRN